MNKPFLDHTFIESMEEKMKVNGNDGFRAAVEEAWLRAKADERGVWKRALNEALRQLRNEIPSHSFLFLDITRDNLLWLKTVQIAEQMKRSVP